LLHYNFGDDGRIKATLEEFETSLKKRATRNLLKGLSCGFIIGILVGIIIAIQLVVWVKQNSVLSCQEYFEKNCFIRRPDFLNLLQINGTTEENPTNIG